MENITQIEQLEKIYIIQPVTEEVSSSARSVHDETISLIESAGAVYAGTIYQRIREVNPSTFIGAGKLAELRERLDGLDLTILFNGDLTPSQTLNISAALDDRKVIDRTTLILDIFAANAKSSEGKLQVELAQLKYIYPRLKGKGEALSRLGGGIGTRGPGETKLETDRRRIRMRIDVLEEKLRNYKSRRRLVDSRREKECARRISLIGYTNTGKSTLLNLLTGADVYAADKLFATLDPTTRRLVIDETEFILTDTVGFLRDLPHNLIAAFHSTLESALNCDLALIVCDARDYEMQLSTTLATLQELECNVPYLIVMNKSELLTSFEGYPADCIFVSAKENIGIEQLRTRIFNFFKDTFSEIVLRVPYAQLSAYNKLKKYVTEKEFDYQDEFVEIKARVPKKHTDKLAPYRVK